MQAVRCLDHLIWKPGINAAINRSPIPIATSEPPTCLRDVPVGCTPPGPSSPDPVTSPVKPPMLPVLPPRARLAGTHCVPCKSCSLRSEPWYNPFSGIRRHGWQRRGQSLGQASEATGATLIDAAKATYFPARTYRNVLNAVRGHVSEHERATLAESFGSCAAPDQKRATLAGTDAGAD